MRNVVFFVTGLDSGGLENYLLRFLRYAGHEFCNIEVFCKGGKGGQLSSEYLKIKNVKIHVRNLSFFNLIDYVSLIRFFKKKNIDTVCDFTGNFAGLVLVAAKLGGVDRRLVFYRGATAHFGNNKFKIFYDKIVKKLTYYSATSILSNSCAAFECFFPKVKYDSRFEVIYNGIDPKPFQLDLDNNLRNTFAIPRDAFVIGHTGRFNYAKNHQIILDVAEILINKYDNFYFLLCGNGVATNLSEVVEKKGLKERMILSENRSDIPVFLNTLDVFLFPSITEGQPNALIEAMVMGIPFVASNIQPIKETVGEFSSNLYPPHDTKGFVNAIENIYSKGAMRNANIMKYSIDRFDYQQKFDQFLNKLTI